MKKTISTKKKTAKILTTINILFALVLSCFPVQEVKGQVFPTVYWSPSTLNITLPLNNTQAGGIFNPPTIPSGNAQSKIVSLYSTTALSNVKLEIDPRIASFLSNAYPIPNSVAAWERKNIFLFFQAPRGTREGTYEGNIQLRSGNNLLPGALKVVIKVSAGAFTLYTNPTDPLLLEAKSSNGSTIEYYGTRDENGSVDSLDMIRATSPDGKTTTYILDEQNRPIEIQGFNGARFKIKYLSETRVFVEIISSDGLVQLSVPMDLNSVDASQMKGNAEVSEPIKSLHKKLRIKDKLNKENNFLEDDLLPSEKTDECKPEVLEKKTNSENQNNSVVTIEVTQCGIPSEDAIVDLEVGGNLFIPGFIRVPKISPGTYQTTLPSPRQAVDNFDKQCTKIANAIGDVCTGFVVAEAVLTGIAGLAVTLGASLGTTLSAAAIAILTAEVSVAIAAALAGIVAVCAITGGGLPDGAPNLFNAICSLSTSAVNRFIAGSSISLRAIANVNGIIKPSQQLNNLNPEGPFEKLSVDLPASDLKVKLVTINPSLPDSSQGYTVNTELGCVDPADNITISYKGKDDSQGTFACPPGATSCSASIPRGRTSSQDVIVIRNNNQIIKVIVVDLTQIGSITVRDNGSLADDAFSVTLDGRFVGQTSVGGSNEFSIRNLSSGSHILSITGVVVPDNVGTYEVSLRNGLTFTGGGTVRSGIVQLNGTATFTIVVP